MAVPKHKTSKAISRTRRSINNKLTAKNLVECGSCGNLVLPHRICPKCGFYRGKQIIELEDMA